MRVAAERGALLVVGTVDERALRDLRDMGYPVHPVPHLARILPELRTATAVVVEVSSRQIGALEMISQLRSDAPESMVPIVAVVPRSDYVEASRARRAGADIVLRGPLDASELVKALRL